MRGLSVIKTKTGVMGAEVALSETGPEYTEFVLILGATIIDMVMHHVLLTTFRQNTEGI